MLTMEGFGLWLWLWLWALLGLWLLLTQLLSLLPKELIPQVTLELDGFLEVVGMWRKHRWSWGCVYSVPKWVYLRSIAIFVVGFWWLWDISDLPLILTTSLTNLVYPKRLPIIALVCLNHHPELRLMTRQPTHHLPELIILILQTIHIVCKL
jgi:hypothetical protein